jgi:hypothetical protein
MKKHFYIMKYVTQYTQYTQYFIFYEHLTSHTIKKSVKNKYN